LERDNPVEGPKAFVTVTNKRFGDERSENNYS